MSENPELFFEGLVPIDYLQLQTMLYKKGLFFADAKRSVARTSRGHADSNRLALSDWGFSLEDVSKGGKKVIISSADNDHIVLPSNQKYVAQKIPNSELVSFPGETHFHVLNHLEELIQKVMSNTKRGFF